MLSHHNIFMWLESLAETQAGDQTGHMVGWSQRPFDYVHNSIFAGAYFSISSNEYLPDLSTTIPFTYCPAHSCSHSSHLDTLAPHYHYCISPHLTLEEARYITRKTVFDIVQGWLGFSNDPAMYNQAQLVYILCNIFGGTTILFLPEVWNAYIRPFSACRGQLSRRR